MKALKLFLIFTALLSGLNAANAAIKVMPTVVELDANKARGNYLTTSFTVEGGKNETIRFKVYPEFFEITEDGKMNTIPKTQALNSLIAHARFVPNEFTLTDGKPQKVRLTLANLGTLPEGESRMVLFLEDVVAKEVILPYSQKDVTTKLVVKTRVGIPIYVDKGKYIKCGRFDDLQVVKHDKDLVYKLKLSSTGNSKVRYTGRAQIIKGKELISEFDVNTNTIKSMGNLYDAEILPLKDIKECGDYTLRVILNYQDEKGRTKNMIKETIFNVQNIQATKI